MNLANSVPPFVHAEIHYAQGQWLLRDARDGATIASAHSSELPKGMRKQDCVRGYLYGLAERAQKGHKDTP